MMRQNVNKIGLRPELKTPECMKMAREYVASVFQNIGIFTRRQTRLKKFNSV